jgi:hypothetical protein
MHVVTTGDDDDDDAQVVMKKIEKIACEDTKSGGSVQTLDL